MDHLHLINERAFGMGNREWRKEIREERRACAMGYVKGCPIKVWAE